PVPPRRRDTGGQAARGTHPEPTDAVDRSPLQVTAGPSSTEDRRDRPPCGDGQGPAEGVVDLGRRVDPQGPIHRRGEVVGADGVGMVWSVAGRRRSRGCWKLLPCVCQPPLPLPPIEAE